MKQAKIIISIVVIGLLIYIGFVTDVFRSKQVTDFESCLAYGNQVLESYPRQCKDKNGVTYIEVITTASTTTTTPPVSTTTPATDITVTLPASGSVVTSPLQIQGTALGKWYFEASFPVSLTDTAGKVIAQSHVTAQGDWMTAGQVPFTVTFPFVVATRTPGFIVFKNDNPSGDPARDVFFKVPVVFAPKPSTATPVATKCVIGGCSGEICSDAADGPAISNCIYKPEFACYKSASCGVQANGKCGWTQDSALKACIAAAQ